jgi:hypothetical protein
MELLNINLEIGIVPSDFNFQSHKEMFRSLTLKIAFLNKIKFYLCFSNKLKFIKTYGIFRF